jgi:hypothetical protein
LQQPVKLVPHFRHTSRSTERLSSGDSLFALRFDPGRGLESEATAMHVDATIVGIVPFDIQEDRYLTVYYVHDDDSENILQARLPASAVYAHPHPNDRVSIFYVLGVVTHIDERAETSETGQAKAAV